MACEIKTRSFLASVLALPAVAFAIDGTNATSTAARPDAVATMAALPARVKLTGLAAIPPQKWAMLEVQEPGQGPVCVLLKPGERIAGIELADIDVRAGRISLRHAGNLMTLALEKERSSAAVIPEPDPNHLPISVSPAGEAGDP